MGTNAKRNVAPPEPGRGLPGGRSKEREPAMEFIAAAVVLLAIFVPVFLALEVATPHPGLSCVSLRPSAELAARQYLAAHPLKPAATHAAANDDTQRIAA